MQNEKNKYSKAFGLILYIFFGGAKEHHHTQQEVAEALGMQVADLSNKIHHGRKFSLDDFIKICEHLEVKDYNEVIQEIKDYANQHI